MKMVAFFIHLLHYAWSLVFWVLMIILIVMVSTGVESKFIYTDF